MHRQKFGSPSLDILFAVILFAIQQGWAMSGLAPNIIVACLIWCGALALLLHALWVWEVTARLRRWAKVAVTLFVPLLLILAIWGPVKREYRKENSISTTVANEAPSNTPMTSVLPSLQPTPVITAQVPTPAPSPLPSSSKPSNKRARVPQRKKVPCNWEDTLYGRC